MKVMEKVLCLVDSQNIYYSPNKGNKRIDYYRLKQTISKGRNVTLIAYLVSDPVIDQTKFLAHLRRFGYITKVKVRFFEDGVIQNSNWDDEIIEDARDLMDQFDTLVLVSGDGDFTGLLSEWKKKNKRVEVVCFPGDASPGLLKVSDQTTFLADTVFMRKTKAGQ